LSLHRAGRKGKINGELFFYLANLCSPLPRGGDDTYVIFSVSPLPLVLIITLFLPAVFLFARQPPAQLLVALWSLFVKSPRGCLVGFECINFSRRFVVTCNSFSKRFVVTFIRFADYLCCFSNLTGLARGPLTLLNVLTIISEFSTNMNDFYIEIYIIYI